MTVHWSGDAIGNLIWACSACAATGSGEGQDGIAAGHAHHCERDNKYLDELIERAEYNRDYGNFDNLHGELLQALRLVMTANERPQGGIHPSRVTTTQDTP